MLNPWNTVSSVLLSCARSQETTKALATSHLLEQFLERCAHLGDSSGDWNELRYAVHSAEESSSACSSPLKQRFSTSRLWNWFYKWFGLSKCLAAFESLIEPLCTFRGCWLISKTLLCCNHVHICGLWAKFMLAPPANETRDGVLGRLDLWNNCQVPKHTCFAFSTPH